METLDGDLWARWSAPARTQLETTDVHELLLGPSVWFLGKDALRADAVTHVRLSLAAAISAGSRNMHDSPRTVLALARRDSRLEVTSLLPSLAPQAAVGPARRALDGLLRCGIDDRGWRARRTSDGVDLIAEADLDGLLLHAEGGSVRWVFVVAKLRGSHCLRACLACGVVPEGHGLKAQTLSGTNRPI